MPRKEFSKITTGLDSRLLKSNACAAVVDRKSEKRIRLQAVRVTSYNSIKKASFVGLAKAAHVSFQCVYGILSRTFITCLYAFTYPTSIAHASPPSLPDPYSYTCCSSTYLSDPYGTSCFAPPFPPSLSDPCGTIHLNPSSSPNPRALPASPPLFSCLQHYLPHLLFYSSLRHYLPLLLLFSCLRHYLPLLV